MNIRPISNAIRDFAMFAALAAMLCGCQPVIVDPIVGEAAARLELLHVNSRNVNWLLLRKTLTSSPTNLDRASSIQFLVDALGDSHTRYVGRDDTMKMANATAADESVQAAVDLIRTEMRDGAAIIVVPTFNFGSPSASAHFAQTLHDRVDGLAAKSPRLWIVDLRDNSGGNMWAMLAGLSCLFDADSLGAFVDANGRQTTWKASVGHARSETDGLSADVLTVNGGCRPHNSDVRRIVLTSARTSSAAEGVAISFMSMPNTKLYGGKTAGMATGNSWVPLSDGSSLLITSAKMQDRVGRTFQNGIMPSQYGERGLWLTGGTDALEFAIADGLRTSKAP